MSKLNLRILFALLPAALASCAHSSNSSEVTSRQIRVHNLIPSFRTFWEKVQSRPVLEQLAAFKMEIVPTFPEFYAFKFEQWKRHGKNPDQQIKESLQEFPALKEKFFLLSESIEAQLQKSLVTFEKNFPDFPNKTDVYLIHSLLEMDGGTRELDGRTTLIFGLESMVRFHRNLDEKSNLPFFHHELFHVYHRQFVHGEKPLYKALWVEGLAVYVAQQLNPEASNAELSLDNPKDLIQLCEAKLPALVKDLSGKLNSQEERDEATYFLGNSTHPWIPKRAGYYLGYRIAQVLSKRHSVAEMVRLNGDPLLEEIHIALGEIGSNRSR